MTFKDHFSGHAAVYREARPTYSEALFDWLAAQAPSIGLAWDAGCGNGQASVALAARFERVFASDPSAEQIANAIARANIDYHVEPAERCSLTTASADLVTVGQALHWFDLERFHAEVRRVLRPGGVLAEWTYADCAVSPAVDVQTDRLYRDLTAAWWPPERALVESGYRTLAFPFERIEVPRFDMTMEWDVDEFLAYLRSWSGSQRLLKATGEDAVGIVEPDLRSAWGDPMEKRGVRWAFHVRCGRRA